MEILLTHIVDDQRRLYQGTLRTISTEHMRATDHSVLILAKNSEEALAKLKMFVLQEYPSVDLSKANYSVSIEALVT